MRVCAFIGFIMCFAAGAASAQSIDFGNDSSQWSNDGECDDPRFEGPGMTSTPLLDSDIGRDASDCRRAYQDGRLTLRRASAPADAVFGDDSSEYANDGECDDRRFYGVGMAMTLATSAIGTDASDCRNAIQKRNVDFWDMTAALQATQCNAIAFGDDSSDFSFDGECDDPRFEGIGSASIIDSENLGADATDCSRLCRFGAVALRDY